MLGTLHVAGRTREQIAEEIKKVLVERPLIPSLFFMRSNKRQALCLERELCGKARLYRQLVDFDHNPSPFPSD